MNKKNLFSLKFISLSCIALLVVLGIYYIGVNEYNFNYSSWASNGETIVRNYLYTKSKDQINVKFDSLNGNKHYSLKKRDYQTLTIEGEMTGEEFNLSLYDDQNQEIKVLTASDFTYQLQLSQVNGERVNMILEGRCAGNFKIQLD